MDNPPSWKLCDCKFCSWLLSQDKFPEGSCKCPRCGEGRMRMIVCRSLQGAFRELKKAEDHEKALQDEVADLRFHAIYRRPETSIAVRRLLITKQTELRRASIKIRKQSHVIERFMHYHIRWIRGPQDVLWKSQELWQPFETSWGIL